MKVQVNLRMYHHASGKWKKLPCPDAIVSEFVPLAITRVWDVNKFVDMYTITHIPSGASLEILKFSKLSTAKKALRALERISKKRGLTWLDIKHESIGARGWRVPVPDERYTNLVRQCKQKIHD